MKIIPEVQCRRCGEVYSSLRTSCPACGTRRVSQSGRTPVATPGTVKGTAAYDRTEANAKWQMIFGLILVVAVILAVIVMVSTSLDGVDSGVTGKPAVSAKPEKGQEDEQGGIPVVEAPPTPAPTPTPSVEKVQIRYATTESLEFAMHMGETPITVNAVAYPVTIENPVFTWSCSNPDAMKITVSEDTKECTCEILQAINGGVKLKVSCFGVEKEIPVYLLD